MTRDYSMVQIAIWTDPDFRNLSVEAQRLYFLLTYQPHTKPLRGCRLARKPPSGAGCRFER